MSPSIGSHAAEPRLPELCGDLFAFALSLRTAKDPGDAAQLFATIGGLLERLSRRARDAGVDSAHLDAARYSLCALLDEIVLGSRWAIKTQWMQKPLQMAYFGDFTAGEQFFRRLDDLRRDSAHDVDAIEVAALCLAAGFRGKYADLAGMQKIDDLLAALNQEIRSARGAQTRALSRPFERADVAPAQAARRLPMWVLAAAGTGFLLILLLSLNALLASQASDFLAGGSGR